MTLNEKYVRSRWRGITAGMDICGYGITLSSKPAHSFIGFEKESAAWEAAAEFTRKREEEIRLTGEEVEVMSRIFLQLNAKLLELSEGMKR